MNKFSQTLLGSVMFAGASVAWAAGQPFAVEGSFALTSDYVFRGVSQTMEDPAVQGGLTLSHESGVYLGTWGSNVRYSEEGGVYDGAHLELDAIVGYATELSSGLGLDMGYAHYFYPGTNDADYGEFYLKGSYGMSTVSYYYTRDLDYTGDGDKDSSHYLELAMSYPLAQGYNLGGSVGWTAWPDSDSDFDDDYLNWKLSISKEFMGLGFELAYTDTDLKDNELADPRAVLTVSKSF